MKTMQKKFNTSLLIALIAATTSVHAEDVHIDLSSHFDVDAFAALDAALGDGLNGNGNWFNTASLPADYANGTAYTTVDGLSSFLFGNLADGVDSLRLDGQVISVPAGSYNRLHAALVTTGTFQDLSKKLTLNYSDGTSVETDLGPMANWFDSPARFFDVAFSWTDTSGIDELLRLELQQNDQDYILESTGSSTEPRNDYRFVDGTSVLTYEFDFDPAITDLTMGIDMSNNFIVSISTDLGGSFVEVLNSQELYGEDVHNGSNRQIYEVDLAPFLAEFSQDNLFQVRFTDGTTNNGWGPSIWSVFFYTGETVTYSGAPVTPLDAENAVVHADFNTGGDEETPYLVTNNGSQISGAGHRYADNGNSYVYGFDLPDDAADAKAALNMEGDFVVSIATSYGVTTPVDLQPGGTRDADYIFEDVSSADAGEFRFVDGGGRLVYLFDLPNDLTEASLQINMQNNFVVSLSSDFIDFTEELNSMTMFGSDIHDGSNRQTFTVALAPYLQNNPENEIFVQFEDGSTGDGWGPAIFNIRVTSGSEPEFVPVLTADEVFADSPRGYAENNTMNKAFYTLDLSSFLADNPQKELYVKFEDGSTANGWGPGLFRFVLFSGELTPRPDGAVMTGLDVAGEAPANVYPFGVNVTRREFDVDEGKTLQSITLPVLNESQNVYLFAATLEGTSTSVADWSVF